MGGHPHQPGLIFPSWWNVSPESGHCHSVYSVVHPVCYGSSRRHAALSFIAERVQCKTKAFALWKQAQIRLNKIIRYFYFVDGITPPPPPLFQFQWKQKTWPYISLFIDIHHDVLVKTLFFIKVAHWSRCFFIWVHLVSQTIILCTYMYTDDSIF